MKKCTWHTILAAFALVGSATSLNAAGQPVERAGTAKEPPRGSDGPRIAFVANTDDNWELFTAKADGSGLQRLTNTDYDEHKPSWSPGGHRIVFGASDDRLRVIDVATKEVHALSTNAQSGADLQPAFHPTGKQIAYVSFVNMREEQTQIRVYDAPRGTSLTALDEKGAYFLPAWSPDGQVLAFSRSLGSQPEEGTIVELFTKDLAGGVTQLTEDDAMSLGPSWSPDGRQLAYACDKAGNFDLWLVEVKSGKTRRLTTTDWAETSPVFSPDGRRLAYVSTQSGRREVWIMDVASGQTKPLRPFGQDRVVPCQDPDW